MLNSLFVVFLLVQLPVGLAQQLDQIVREVEQIRFLLAPPPQPPPPPSPPPPYVLPDKGSQAALNAVAPGSVVHLDPALVYPALDLKVTGVTVKTLGFEPQPRAPTTGLAKVPSLIVSGADVSVVGVEVSSNANDLIQCVKAAANATFDNVYIHGDPTSGAKNGITLQCAGATLRRSVVDDIFRRGQESHAIVGWDGPGPYVIEDNVLQAASINILFGGADPSTTGRVPSNITIARNTITKKLEWRGKGYAVKNLLELKNAKQVRVTDNTLQYSWVDGQTGYGFVIGVQNQSGRCPWCVVEDVTVERNTIKDIGTAVAILARDDRAGFPSDYAKRITFRDNTFANINRATYGGRGAAFELHRGPEDLVIEGTRIINTPLNYHSWIQFGAGAFPAVRLIVRNNPRIIEGHYGMLGDGSITVSGQGTPALAGFAPGYTWENNSVIKSGIRTIQWPAGTVFIKE